MKISFRGCIFILPAVFFCFNTKAQDTDKRINIGFVYPVSSNGRNAAAYTNSFSFNAILGVSRAETGVTVAGISSVIKEDASGFQISGVYNQIGNNATGMQIAGITNIVKNEADGFQIAGVSNIAGTSSGLSLAGVTNITKGNARGLQIAGLLNSAKGNAGSQISVINSAQDVSGLQFGFMNIAEKNDYPVGIINLIKDGEKAISISVDETKTSLLSFRSGGRKLYGILGIGYNFNDKKNLYALETGFGAHFYFGRQFRINTELVNTILTDFKKGSYTRNAIRVLPAYEITDHVEIFAGPTFNFVYLENGKGDNLTKHYVWSRVSEHDTKGLFFGGIAGIQIKL